MKTACPSCGKNYEIDMQYTGQTIQCPDCKTDFLVQNPNLVPCPDCFTPISKRAAMCPHCGASFTGNGTGPSSQDATEEPPDISSEEDILVCRPSYREFLSLLIVGTFTVPFLVGIIILAFVWVQIKHTCYRITSHRIVIQQGWITKHQDEIWIKDIRSVKLLQRFWQRINKVGNISIGTAGTADHEISIIGIANPQQVIDMINALRRKEK